MNLHHILTRDDLEANLAPLCGSGTTGHHGLVTHRDADALDALRRVLRARRPDTVNYLIERLGSRERAGDWLQGGL